MSNYIRGLIQLTSPLHVASVDEKGKTMTRPVFDKSGRRFMVPIFPGNDLRGRLRRKAAKYVIDALVSDQRRVSLETYMGLMCGTAVATPDSKQTVEEFVRASRNIYMGLFGGGSRILRSRYAAADLVPVVKATVEAGCVPEWLQSGTESEAGRVPPLTVCVGKNKGSDELVYNSVSDGYSGLTANVNMVRVDDVMRVSDGLYMEATVEAAAEKVDAYQARVAVKNKVRKDEKLQGMENDENRTKKIDAGNMFAAEAVAAGVHLWTDILLDDHLTLAQVGLFVQAFADIVKEQKLGGLSSKGFGRFRTKNMVICHPALSDGVEIKLFEEDGSEARLSPQLAPALEAMRNELARLDLDEMSSYFINRDGKE